MEKERQKGNKEEGRDRKIRKTANRKKMRKAVQEREKNQQS